MLVEKFELNSLVILSQDKGVNYLMQENVVGGQRILLDRSIL